MSQQPTQQKNAQQPPERRMSLSSVHKPNSSEAWSGMLYSTEGLGKTTFGASAPAPIFIAPEAGFPRGVRPDLFPQPKTWNDLYDAVRELQEGKHNFKTLVFDTLDWLQPLLFAYIMKKNGDVDSMEKVGGGYGRGYDLALIEMLRFLGVLERLRQTRNMNILFLVHAEITTFKTHKGLTTTIGNRSCKRRSAPRSASGATSCSLETSRSLPPCRAPRRKKKARK
jgi:hypothetical protein